MCECDDCFGLRAFESLDHFFRCDVKAWGAVESPFVDERDDSGPVADIDLIVLSKRLLECCMVLILVLSVSRAGDLERPVDALPLDLEAVTSNLLADVSPD